MCVLNLFLVVVVILNNVYKIVILYMCVFLLAKILFFTVCHSETHTKRAVFGVAIVAAATE